MSEEEKKKTQKKITPSEKPEKIQEGIILETSKAQSEKETEKAPQKEPEKEGEPPVVDTAPILAEIEKLWKENKFLEKKIEFINNTNWLIVLVLFVGFLILLFSMLTVYVEAKNNTTATQVEFIKGTIYKVTLDVDNYNFPML